MNRKLMVKLFSSLLVLSLVVALTGKGDNLQAAEESLGEKIQEIINDELPPGQYFTVKDEKTGKIVTKTSRYVHEGDEVITKNNEHYQVSRIEGKTAYAKLLGIDTSIVWNPEWDKYIASLESGHVPVQAEQKKKSKINDRIAIYHTHSAESYVPTDGTESKPSQGGIFKVGATFSESLKNNGAEPILSLRPHEPHDANAYHRSRRTALQLLKKQPIALIDVHRDGVPDPEFYTGEVKAAPNSATAIRLVVGKQNPNMQANLEFAKQIKAYMDKRNPGLIKEIFMAKGNYNQDLSPRAILIEAGTHTNKREQAQKGVSLFAESLTEMLGIQDQQNQEKPAPAPAPGNQGQQGTGSTDSPGSWRSLWFILGALIIGGLAFLFISTGSLKGSKEKLNQFVSKEWANALGVKEKSQKDSSSDSKESRKDKE